MSYGKLRGEPLVSLSGWGVAGASSMAGGVELAGAVVLLRRVRWGAERVTMHLGIALIDRLGLGAGVQSGLLVLGARVETASACLATQARRRPHGKTQCGSFQQPVGYVSQ